MIKEYGPTIARSAASALDKYLGGSAVSQQGGYIVKFTAPQLRHIRSHMHGSGVFSDIASTLSSYLPAARSYGQKGLSKALGPALHLFKKGQRGSNLLTLGATR